MAQSDQTLQVRKWVAAVRFENDEQDRLLQLETEAVEKIRQTAAEELAEREKKIQHNKKLADSNALLTRQLEQMKEMGKMMKEANGQMRRMVAERKERQRRVEEDVEEQLEHQRRMERHVEDKLDSTG